MHIWMDVWACWRFRILWRNFNCPHSTDLALELNEILDILLCFVFFLHFVECNDEILNTRSVFGNIRNAFIRASEEFRAKKENIGIISRSLWYFQHLIKKLFTFIVTGFSWHSESKKNWNSMSFSHLLAAKLLNDIQPDAAPFATGIIRRPIWKIFACIKNVKAEIQKKKKTKTFTQFLCAQFEPRKNG